MATIRKVSLRPIDQPETLKPGELEILNKALWEIEQKLNEMIDKLNTL